MIGKEEIIKLAEKYNKSYEEMEKEICLLLKELEETNKGINDTIERNGYIRFPNDLSVFGYGNNNELNDKYLCFTPNIKDILNKPKSEIAIVSGFGATNTPTVGTLSMILKLIELQKETGLYTYCIINDLGSINARNIDINTVTDLTEKFREFLIKMGFDLENGEIRTHNDLDHARTFSLVSRYIKLDDFKTNGEATDDTYKRLNLKGNDFSVLVDHVYTATDVLLPILKDGKSGIIVPCGLEEYYHANIGGIALQRMMEDGTIKSLIPENVEVGAIYSKLVKGFFPYFKQSKSIPNSSVNLGDTEEEIYDKIVLSSTRDDDAVLDMIVLASNFSNAEISSIINAYNNRNTDYQTWLDYKKEYADYFLSVKEVWDSCKNQKVKLKNKIYK